MDVWRRLVSPGTFLARIDRNLIVGLVGYLPTNLTSWTYTLMRTTTDSVWPAPGHRRRLQARRTVADVRCAHRRARGTRARGLIQRVRRRGRAPAGVGGRPTSAGGRRPRRAGGGVLSGDRERALAA
jgi:hypothetical protein